MKIFLTVSRTGMKEYLRDYQKVLDELRSHKVQVYATFEKKYIGGLHMVRKTAKSNKQKQYANDNAIRKAILNSDAVVFEASYPSFRLGFETFYALTVQKPVLVLSKNRDYAGLIDQPHFFGAQYTDFTLPDEIEKFLRHVKQCKLRSRFNLFISDMHKQKLERSAKHFGVSMSDYIRKLIEEDIGV